ncbi:MAG: T9SS type A sorting domain-containing protein, partial [Bacteroidetes bacterium]
TNGGTSWKLQPLETFKDLQYIKFADVNTGLAIGDFGAMLKTTNGGSAWARKSGVSKTEMVASYFPTTSIGYQVGEGGFVMKTTNGGYTWEDKRNNIDLSEYYWLYSLTFLNDQVGWVVGESSYIAKTVNGGNGWSVLSSGLGEDAEFNTFYSIFFIDNLRGWITGDYGLLMKSVNGGSAWEVETTNVDVTLNEVKFINQNIGWAVGDFGTIIKSTDGGVHWFEQNSGTGNTFYALDIVDQNTVFACADYGTIVYTVDGGNTWQVHSNEEIFESFKDIAAFTKQNVWAVGEEGIIYGSTNGGITWQIQQREKFYELKNVQAIPVSSGAFLIACGEGNTVLTSAVSPLPLRKWTGATDSLWTNAANWTPNGTPQMYDSVYIPSSSRRPTMRHATQRINVASLHVGTGGSLYIGSGISELVVSGGVLLNGGLDVETNTRTDFSVGGGFIINNGVFNQGNSPVTLTGSGKLKGTFTTLVLAESSKIVTGGNVAITGSIFLNSILTGSSSDTISITTTDTLAIQGLGTIEGGTVKRAIASNSTAAYRFGSPATTVQFYPGGTIPTHVMLTSFPNYLSPGFSDSLFVRRYYVGKTLGGSNFKAKVFLAFTEDETYLFPVEVGFFIDSSGLLINLGSSDFIDNDELATGLDSVSNFTTWYLGDLYYYPKPPLEFSATLKITDNGAQSDSLLYGSLKNATNGIDPDYNEAPLGAKPPAGTFDARWVLPTNVESKIDFRPFVEGAQVQNIFTCNFQPGPGGYPVQLSWNFESTSWGKLFLRDEATQGSKFNVNMKAQSSLVISDTSVKSVQIVQDAPFNINVQQNWNIVSMPVTPVTSSQKLYVFPMAASQAFYFNNGYFPADSFTNGRGYWLKFHKAQSVGLEGNTRILDTFNVNNGWNMIGSISSPVPTSSITQIPSAIVASQYFEYINGYIPDDSIKPGKGYWVRTSQAGKLRFAASGFDKHDGDGAMPDWNTFSRVVIRDGNGGNQPLYFGEKQRLLVPLSWCELPPLPPSGSFDARFSSNRMFEPMNNEKENKFRVSIHSEKYPVTIRCEGVGNDVQFVNVTDAKRGTSLGIVSADGKSVVTISNPAISEIELSVKSGVAIPKVFSLEQNYPNPFNPSTNIQFNLPEPAIVSLQIYNILGQQVSALIDNTSYSPGSHITTWDASAFASGMYFYRIIAQKPENGEIVFQQVKKLVLVK